MSDRVVRTVCVADLTDADRDRPAGWWMPADPRDGMGFDMTGATVGDAVDELLSVVSADDRPAILAGRIEIIAD